MSACLSVFQSNPMLLPQEDKMNLFIKFFTMSLSHKIYIQVLIFRFNMTMSFLDVKLNNNILQAVSVNYCEPSFNYINNVI